MKKLVYSILVLFFSAIAYPQVTTLWEKSLAAGTMPEWDGGTVRGIAYGSVNGNDRVYVVTRAASVGGKQIVILNAATGDSVGTLDTTGISGGTLAVNDVEVSTDGKIFVGNLASGGTFKVYKYDTEASAPVAVIEYDATGMRLGDKFTVTGSTADNSIIIWAANATGNGNILKFKTTDNGNSFTPEIINKASTGTAPSVGPLPNGDFYYNIQGGRPQKYQADGTFIGEVASSVISTGGSAIRYLNTISGDEFIVSSELLATTINNAKILKIPGGVPAASTEFGTTNLLGNVSAGGNGDVAVQKVNDYVYNLFVVASLNGFGAYQVDMRTPLAGEYYIPQGSNPQGFATLAEAVAALNINGASGTVNFILDADTLREASFTFNADLSADNNVVIKPAPGRDVVLFVTAGPSKGNGPQMIGFDRGYVTFDGSNNGTSTRNLIISTEEDGVAVPFGLNTANADTVTLKNLIIKNIVDVPLNFRYGAVINDVGGVWGFRVENCQIGSADKPVRRDGLAPWGGGAVPNNFSIVNNEIYAGVRGVTTIYLVDCEIIGNTINMIPADVTGGTDAYNHGIYITGGSGVLDISDNVINCLAPTVINNSYLIGIAFAGNSESGEDWFKISNNMINMGSASETRSVYGIGLRSAQPMGNLKVYHNTILINEMTSTAVSYGIGNHSNGTGPVNIDLKNNIIINKHTGNNGSSAIGLIPATSVLASDFNDLYSAKNLVNFTGSLYADLAAWRAAGRDSNSVSKLVEFVSATDLHLAGASVGDGDLAGTPIAIVTTDIDGELRSTTFPYMGADEGGVVIPVELTSFAAAVNGKNVELNWTTATETNNRGFEVERKITDNWEKIGFIPGTGTTTEVKRYSFVDTDVPSGKLSYRLKQIDYDGTFSYSYVVEVEINTITNFELLQNYPNPFNPNTDISFMLPVDAKVKLEIYSVTGELVEILANEFLPAGKHVYRFDASGYASGTYIYRLTSDNISLTRKMILMK